MGCRNMPGLHCDCTNWKHKLIGQIDSSYLISDKGNWFFKNVLLELCKNYKDRFFNIGRDYPTTNTHPYTLKEMWVNYQKQTEFNPVHSHTGVYSFVVWMQIPTNYTDQRENPIAKNTNGDVISNFQFNYMDILGKIHSVKVIEDSPYDPNNDLKRV